MSVSWGKENPQKRFTLSAPRVFLLSSTTPAKKSSSSPRLTRKSLRALLIGCLSSNQQHVFFSGGVYAAPAPFTGLELDLRITREVLGLSTSPCWTWRPLRASSSRAIIMKASSTFWLCCAHKYKCKGVLISIFLTFFKFLIPPFVFILLQMFLVQRGCLCFSPGRKLPQTGPDVPLPGRICFLFEDKEKGCKKIQMCLQVPSFCAWL